MDALANSIKSFEDGMQAVDAASPAAYAQVAQLFYGVSAAIAQAEVRGLSREAIIACAEPARTIMAWSPFGKRMQTWPRGYPGDFETVEWIVNQTDRAPPHSTAALLERLFLSRPICQQHRNKIAYQADLIRTLCNSTHDDPNTLIIASGSALDLRAACKTSRPMHGRFVINDMDKAALDSASAGLGTFANRCHFVVGNTVNVADTIAGYGPFNLIIAGGLFDYLSNRAIQLLFELANTEWLKPGGVFYFSNILKGNQYRYMMQYLENWNVIERDENDCEELLLCIRDSITDIKLSRDCSGLTLLGAMAEAMITFA